MTSVTIAEKGYTTNAFSMENFFLCIEQSGVRLRV
jgi:hypothetical protein